MPPRDWTSRYHIKPPLSVTYMYVIRLPGEILVPQRFQCRPETSGGSGTVYNWPGPGSAWPAITSRQGI